MELKKRDYELDYNMSNLSILELMALECYRFKKVGRIEFNPFNNFDSPDMNENIKTSGDNPITILGYFHIDEVQKVELADDYLFDIRANTHILEFGFSEYDFKKYVIHTGNHKGQRIIDIYLFTQKGEK